MMVMPVKYKNISLYFFCDGHESHFQRVGEVRKAVEKNTWQRCGPFVCTFCVFERGIKHPIVIFYMRS